MNGLKHNRVLATEFEHFQRSWERSTFVHYSQTNAIIRKPVLDESKATHFSSTAIALEAFTLEYLLSSLP